MFGTRSSIQIGRSGASPRLVRGKGAQRMKGVETAALGSGSVSAGAPGSGGFMGERVYISGIDVSTPYVDDIDHRTLCGMFRDLYLHDPVPGAAVDLMSNLPFSTFKLNVPAQKADKILEAFQNTLEALKIQSLLPPAHREHMVFGFHTSMLVYKAQTKTFTDTLPIPPQDIEVQSNMLFGHDPILRVTRSEMLSEFLADPSPVAKSIIQRLSPRMISMLRSGDFELDPISTLYYPRRAWAFQGKGESYYRRILPIYMLEKVLFRGTLTLANRRQSSILHVTGGSDDWEITAEELSEIVRGFQEADKDPIGSVVGTRNEVQVNEVRQGGDFWKYSDITQELDGKKLLALGINESFLSGDMNYNSMEHALSVFMESLRASREEATNQLFYHKLFPLISITNGFTKAEYGDSDSTVLAASAGRRMESTGMETEMMNADAYVIPRVEWDKKLMPEGDEEQLDILEKLEEKGIPLSLRAWAAAGGLDIDLLMKQREASIDDEIALARIDKVRGEKFKSAGLQPTGRIKSDDGDDDSFLSSVARHSSLPSVNLLDRKFRDSDFELFARSPTGKKQFKANQDRAQKNANRIVAATLQRMSEQNGSRAKRYYAGGKKNVVES